VKGAQTYHCDVQERRGSPMVSAQETSFPCGDRTQPHGGAEGQQLTREPRRGEALILGRAGAREQWRAEDA